MPIQDDEKFLTHFIADTEEQAERMMQTYNKDIGFLASKLSSLTGVDSEDLYQEGLIGLARANRDFEEGRSENFRIFAIYKIKDAMKAFITRQAINIRSPQYLKDALRLITALKLNMSKAVQLDYQALTDIWDRSKVFKSEKSLMETVDSIRDSLIGLAERSHTSVPQLLERLDLLPISVMGVKDYGVIDNFVPPHQIEDNLIELILAKDSVSNLKDLLTADDFKLLYDRFVEGVTVRELERELGIKAASIVIRTNNIVKKIHRNKDKILKWRNHAIVKETEQGHSG